MEQLTKRKGYEYVSKTEQRYTTSVKARIDRQRLGSSALSYRQKLLLFAVCVSYITAVPMRQFVSSINPDLKTDKSIHFSNEMAGVMYVIAGMGYSIGKLLDGIFIDRFGAIKCFIIFQVVTVVGVMIFSFLDNVVHFTIILSVNAFVQAGLWPAIGKLFYEVLSPAQFSSAFAWLGISSRLGSAYSKVIIGYLLYHGYSWREAIRIQCIIGALGILWFAIWMYAFLQKEDRVSFAYPQYNQIKRVLHDGTPQQQERIKYEVNRQLNTEHDEDAPANRATSYESMISDNNNNGNMSGVYDANNSGNLNSESALRHEVQYNQETIFDEETLKSKLYRFVSNSRFVSICVCNMFITMVVGLDAFNELMLTDVLGPSDPNINNGIYVMIASTFPLGLTCALLMAYVFFRDKETYWLANYVNISLVIAVLFCMALLGWTWVMEMFGCADLFTCTMTISLIFFGYGFLLAYPYYIETGVFALRFGGQDAGLVACLIDFCGYLPSSFLLIIGAWLSDYGWRYVFVMTLVNVCMTAVAFMYFNHFDVMHERKERLMLLNVMNDNENNHELNAINRNVMNHLGNGYESTYFDVQPIDESDESDLSYVDDRDPLDDSDY